METIMLLVKQIIHKCESIGNYTEDIENCKNEDFNKKMIWIRQDELNHLQQLVIEMTNEILGEEGSTDENKEPEKE